MEKIKIPSISFGSITDDDLFLLSLEREDDKFIWITFNLFEIQDRNVNQVVLELASASSRTPQKSEIFERNSIGRYENLPSCRISARECTKFSVYLLTPISKARSAKIDHLHFKMPRRVEKLLEFSVIPKEFFHELKKPFAEEYRDAVQPKEGCKISFSISFNAPDLPIVDEVKSISDDISSSIPHQLQHSTYHGISSEGNPNLARKSVVRFNDDVQRIPSTSQLQEEIRMAVQERGNIERKVRAISLQVARIESQIENLKGEVSKLLDSFWEHIKQSEN